MMMESPSYIILFSMLILCRLVAFCNSFSSSMNPRCHEAEKSALLQLKDSFLSTNSCYYDWMAFSYSKLESWKDLQGERGDCCLWDGVECDENTNHVISLDLNTSCLSGFIASKSTIFRLVHLQKLNLALNYFHSSKIPPEISNLSSLTYLNLSRSYFSGRIPPQLCNLSKLVSLDLSYNSGLKFHLRDLVQPSINLKELPLSYVNISSSVPQLLPNFSSLESLCLGSCGLNNEFPTAIFHLPNLKILDLSGNLKLGGYLPKFQLGSSLESLSLSRTNFGGELTPSIGNLAYLEELQIDDCNFTGKLPPSLGNLTNLKYLDLSNNSFSSTVTSSLSWLGKLSKLSSFSFSEVNLYGEFPSSLMNLTQLSYLDLSYNRLTGPIPSWVMNMTKLVALFLDGNHLNSKIPPSLIYGTKIEYLNLFSNQLTGEIPSETNNHSQLIHLDLSSNKLQGSIPTTISYLKNLQSLELSSNNLVGTVDLNSLFHLKSLTALMLSFNNLRLLVKSNMSAPNFLILGLASCNLNEFPNFLLEQSRLDFLDLSSNQIHGQIPSWIWNTTSPDGYLNISHNLLTHFEEGPDFHQWAHLRVLDLRSNMLQGSLLHESRSSYECNLYMINLSHNQLRGQIPRSLANCSRLELLNFGHNQLADTFPSWLGILPELKVLILQSNGFYGAVGKIETTSSFSKLQIIDISYNAFTGDLPTLYFETWYAMMNANASNIPYMKNWGSVYGFDLYYSITMNNKGLELEYLKIPNTFAAIDFSRNKFQGVIPDAIENLTGIHMLNLSYNKLTGYIPSSIANLKQLESLDLSGNELFGKIPFQLSQLTSLSSFNLSYNNLSGLIPHGRQFDTFDNNSYQGNLGLCGVPLKNNCEPMQPPPSNLTQDEDSESGFEVNWLIVAMGYASGLVVGVVAGNEVMKRKYIWFMKIFLRKQQRRPRRRC